MAAGHHGGGRPLAAARGCRLLRRFFFLLKTRKVILAGPRQGQASLRSVRTRTLDMAFSARIGTAQEGGRKRKGSCWIPGSWDLSMSYNPIVVTLSSLKPFFFNGLKKELCFSDNAWSIRPRNPIRAIQEMRPGFTPSETIMKDT